MYIRIQYTGSYIYIFAFEFFHRLKLNTVVKSIYLLKTLIIFKGKKLFGSYRSTFSCISKKDSIVISTSQAIPVFIHLRFWEHKM